MSNIDKGPEYYAKLFEYAGEAILLETKDGSILDANPTACKLLGYSKEELLNINALDLIDIAEKNKVIELLEESDCNGGSFTCRNICKDGRKIPVEVRVRGYREKGELLLIVIVRDVTEQIQAMEKIRKQNDYLLLLHEMNIGILDRLDLDELLNKLIVGACEMFGTEDAFLYLLDEYRGVMEMKVGVGRNANLNGYIQNIGQGAAGTVAATGKPLVIDNYSSWPGRDTDPKWDTLQTCVCIPFKSDDKVIGVLGLDYFDHSRSFSPEEMQFLSQFAELVSIALVKANLHRLLAKSEKELQQKNEALITANEELLASEEELRQQLEKLLKNGEKITRQNMVLTLLNQTAVGLMYKLDIDEVLGTIVACATDFFGTGAHIWLVDEERNRLALRIGIKHPPKMKGWFLRLGEGVAGKVAQNGKPLVVENYQQWPGRAASSDWDALQTCACAPLTVSGKVIGVIDLDFYYSRSFSPEEMQLLSQLAELASIALYNASLIADYKREIKDRLQTEGALRKSENRYKSLYTEFQEKQAFLTSLINSIPDLIFYKDGNSVYLGCNTAFAEFAGLQEKEIAGLSDSEIFSKELAVYFKKMDSEVIRNQETCRNEVLVQYPDGRQILLDILKTPYYDYQGNAIGLIGVGRDITERKKKEDEILYLSLHDALTGLYNRAFFEEEMKRLEGARDIFVGLIVFDVDGLKIINDTLGHNTGDLILKAVAKILKASFNAGDLVARIGGDEFAVLIDHNSEQVFEVACQRIKDQVELYNIENPTMPISLSIGFAANRGRPVDMNALFKEADNNMYREKLHRDKSSRSAIVQTLMKALEARDFQTEGHSERMQDLIASFAAAVGLPEQSLSDLRLLARFHDIGKVGIPDNILFKPGKLSEEELSIMRQHCEIGYRIALSAPDLTPIADWILKHQEWWNGKGYPLGISGESIPLECRMLSIVDAYDAMTSDRPYRKAMSHQTAVNELKNCAGTQFDPALVEKFVALKKSP